MNEIEAIIERYKRRDNLPEDRYSYLSPWMYMHEQEKERAIIRLIKKVRLYPINNKTLLEIGCGTGGNLLQFIRLGFSPNFIVGNELIPQRALLASERTPSQLKIIEGNALDLKFEDNSFDIVYQSMVFSSILDFKFRKELALKIWNLTKVGGGILWYDFIYNNPVNNDVQGIPFRKIKTLFPTSEIFKYKISLAPPIARRVSKIHFRLYDIFNSVRFLRTHLLCWIMKTK